MIRNRPVDRRCGVPATSVLMDLDTYEVDARFGTNADKHGQLIRTTSPRPSRLLHGGEKDLYDLLTSGDAPVLRVEQERIQLTVAAEVVQHLASIRQSNVTPARAIRRAHLIPAAWHRASWAAKQHRAELLRTGETGASRQPRIVSVWS